MKIAVSANGTNLSSLVAPLPGPSIGFIVYEPNCFRFSVLDKASVDVSSPDLIDGWIDLIADAGVDVLIAGGIALEAAHQLSRSGIRTYECISATVWEAIQALKLNLLCAVNHDPEGNDVGSASND